MYLDGQTRLHRPDWRKLAVALGFAACVMAVSLATRWLLQM